MFVTIMLFFSLCARVRSNEQECSPFHYEEKTLEKMIKTEIYVDKIKSDTKNMHQEMTEGFTGIYEELNNTKREITNAMEYSKKAIDQITEHLDGTVTSHAVAFHAHNLKKTYLRDGETLVFSTTKFDIGSGYDNKTGVYVTPVAGIYIFNLQLCITNVKYVYFEISTDKEPILKGCFYDDYSSYNGCAATTVVALLGAKENVWIKHVRSTSGAEFWKTNDVWNSFSGVLISAISK